MYIVLGSAAAEHLNQKYLVLELDTVEYSGGKPPVTAYGVVDSEHIPLQEVNRMSELTMLHEKMMENYKKRNWKFCIDAVEHLRGKFKGELDEFYQSIEDRSRAHRDSEPSEDWSATLKVTADDCTDEESAS